VDISNNGIAKSRPARGVLVGPCPSMLCSITQVQTLISLARGPKKPERYTSIV
jgi:hypothetical protein